MLDDPIGIAVIIERYGLDLLHEPADFSLKVGDFALTRDGDVQFGSAAFSAMFRLVDTWRLNAPALRLAYRTVYELKARARAFEDQLEENLSRAFDDWNWSAGTGFEEAILAYHATNDKASSAVLSRGALAGSVMVVASSLLGRFKGDCGPTKLEWESTGDLLPGGHSVGRAIIAAANSFRHSDEWAEARHLGSFTSQQRASMDVLAAVFGGAFISDPLGDAIESEKMLDVFGSGDFEAFEGAVLRFANAVAWKVERRNLPT